MFSALATQAHASVRGHDRDLYALTDEPADHLPAQLFDVHQGQDRGPTLRTQPQRGRPAPQLHHRGLRRRRAIPPTPPSLESQLRLILGTDVIGLEFHNLRVLYAKRTVFSAYFFYQRFEGVF